MPGSIWVQSQNKQQPNQHAISPKTKKSVVNMLDSLVPMQINHPQQESIQFIPLAFRNLETTQVQHDQENIARQWKELTMSGKKVTIEQNMAIAAGCQCTVGKWRIFCCPSTLHYVWTTLAEAVVEGKVGCSAKVTSTSSVRGAQHSSELKNNFAVLGVMAGFLISQMFSHFVTKAIQGTLEQVCT